MTLPRLFCLAALLVAGVPALAASPAEFLARFEQQARVERPGFAASSARGQRLFVTAFGGDWRCSSCHTTNPASSGRHRATGKPIEPLAPAANPERLVSERKVEKWFRRNCMDVMDRPCSAAEKADVVAYLLGIAR